MRTIYENKSTPAEDGFWMPGEFEPQSCVWMLWPHRTDNWRDGAKPAQKAYAAVARAIARFTPVKLCVNESDYGAAHKTFLEDENMAVIEMSSNDSWMRDCGPSFVVNGKGDLRLVHWHFNAWGGFVDGLYLPWDKDAEVGAKIAEMVGIDRYRPMDFVLEGGSFHVDGEGTLITTEMCLLSEGRNPQYAREHIENLLKSYLGVSKIIWVKDGIDPNETNGHIDDVACFVAPGVVACAWTDDATSPFYEAVAAAYDTLSQAVDAKGRKLEVHKVCLPKKPIYMTEEEVAGIDRVEGTIPRTTKDPCITSYLNFLITNGGVIVPQYGDENDKLALEQIQALFPDHEAVGVYTREIVYGGGNVHCITQQQPRA